MAGLLPLSDSWVMTCLMSLESITRRNVNTEFPMLDTVMEDTYTRANALLQVGQAKGFV